MSTSEIQPEEDGHCSTFEQRPPEEPVYVAVGEGKSSKDAVLWALQNAVGPRSVVYLVHIFPEVRQIPTPLGMMPKAGANPQQVEAYMNQVIAKRRELLKQFIKLCEDARVRAETMLSESDQVARGVLDLIPIVQMNRLIVGTTRSSKKWRRGGGGKAEQMQRGAPPDCTVTVIHQGKELSPEAAGAASPSSSSSPAINATPDARPSTDDNGEDARGVLCKCFSGKKLKTVAGNQPGQ